MAFLWVKDIVAIPAEKRNWRHWTAIGEHHAQTTVARIQNSLPSDKWEPFYRGVMAGAKHEKWRLQHTSEGPYWNSFVDHFDLILDLETCEKKWAPSKIRV